MNNESGSTLQKASFALLVLIAAALAYLIVRDRTRTNEAVVQESASASERNDEPADAMAVNPAEMKSSFAPLRPRTATNTFRPPAGNPPLLPRPVAPTLGDALSGSIEGTIAPRALQDNAPVPVATTSGTAGEARSDGVIAGRVTLRGAPPPEKAIALDAICGRLHPAPMFTRHFVVGREAGLGNVFVYIKSGAPKDMSRPSTTPLMDNVACEFQPYMLGVRAGQPFTLRNSDPILHNMHMTAKPGSGNREVNLGMPVKGMSSRKVFDHPEIFIKVKCDVHPWMFSFIGVVEHRWFAVTDGDGNFALPPSLPPGEYTLAAVHLKAGEQIREVTMTDRGAGPVNFTVDAP